MAFTLRGDDVCTQTIPTPLPNPYWVVFSASAAKLIDLPLNPRGVPEDEAWLALLAGNSLNLKQCGFTDPISTVYSGHQFGVWAGQLGDGRAILLGDIHGQELQLKGAGKTPYSRMGDGRAVLRSSIREFLCSEAMHHLGIPTSRALAIVGSKQRVIREALETAAVCTRLAPSFLRVGHFEHFASLQNTERLQELADYLIEVHYPECVQDKNPYLALFTAISKRNAELVAEWQAVGFCHGVLNTDNISVLGLTIDYGPFGFLDGFQIDHICNHSDHAGRYAYFRQPQIMHWNMACLASGFLPLLELNYSEQEAQDALRSSLETFQAVYAQKWQSLFRAKLGFEKALSDDTKLIEQLLQIMHDSRVDFTYFFRRLSVISKLTPINTIALRNDFLDREKFDQWMTAYLERLQSETRDDGLRAIAMNLVNPKFILRNHLAQAAIEKAALDDFSEVTKLHEILSKPFDEQQINDEYALPPPADLQTIAVSCSS
uniref:protein adenylyltransferase SelO n=1 Tax=Polynucleobacter sp. TaxID=2029855 RepID=UPI004048309B